MRDRAKLDAIRDRSVAWMSVALDRQKRLPSYEQFVDGAAKAPLTAADIAEKDAALEELAASSGLTVMRDPEPMEPEDGA